jgi:Beta-propeller repeat
VKSARYLVTVIFVALAVMVVRAPLPSPRPSEQQAGLMAVSLKAQSPSGDSRLKQANLPLYFEANQGQTDERVKFLSRGAGYTLFLTEDGATLSLRMPQADDSAHAASFGDSAAGRPDRGLRANAMARGRRQSPTRYATDSVQLKLAAANPSPALSGESPQAGRVNYFIGKDPSRWHAGITTYGGVRYANVYPGVDMLFHGSQQQLEYDFEVAPGADPSRIALQVNGARDLRVDRNGDAIVSTPLGDVALHKPVTYQGEGATRTEIASNFELRADGTLGFHVDDYDRHERLVIDPVLTYSTYLGGTNTDLGTAMTTNSSGQMFITGITESTDFPTTPGAFQTVLGNEITGFVSEFNATGSALVFSTYLGGTTGQTWPLGIDLDSKGNIYVTGYTAATDFPTTANAYQKTMKGINDAFLTAFLPGGAAVQYSTMLGGKGDDAAWHVRTGNPGIAYITGNTASTNFPVSSTAFKTKLKLATRNCFVTKLNTDLSGAASLLYSTYLGGSKTNDDDWCYGIARDTTGHAYVVGFTSSTDFPTTAGAHQTVYGGGTADAFVTQLKTNGTGLVYSTYLGGEQSDTAYAVRLDSSNNAYVTGSTASTKFPTTKGAFQRVLGGDYDGFVTKVNSTGSALVYSTYVGGLATDYESAIFVDGSGNAYVGGTSYSNNYPLKNPIQATKVSTLYDGVATVVSADGKSLLFSTYIGGSGNPSDILSDAVQAVSARNNNMYLSGGTCSTDFPVTPGVYQSTLLGECDAFAVEIGNVVP